MDGLTHPDTNLGGGERELGINDVIGVFEDCQGDTIFVTSATGGLLVVVFMGSMSFTVSADFIIGV